jgi:RNA polymerase sigma factor (sigma-70 family)
MQTASHGMGSLMVAAQNGDRNAYAVLLVEAKTWLSRYYSRKVAPSLIDDLVQDTLMALHNKRHTYDGAQPFLPWLAAIARYKWIDWLRREISRREDDLPEAHPAFATASHESPVLAALSVEALLSRLKPAQSQAIRLVKLEGHSVEEAADMSGQSPSLVKVNIHRGMKQLLALVEVSDDE